MRNNMVSHAMIMEVRGLQDKIIDLQEKLQLATEAIQAHKTAIIGEHAELYMKKMPSCSATKLWKVLDKL